MGSLKLRLICLHHSIGAGTPVIPFPLEHGLLSEWAKAETITSLGMFTSFQRSLEVKENDPVG